MLPAYTALELQEYIAAGRLNFAAPIEAEFRRDCLQRGYAGRLAVLGVPLLLFTLAPLYGPQLFEPPAAFLPFLRLIELGVIAPALGTAILTLLLPRLHSYADAALIAATLALALGVTLLAAAGNRVGFHFPAYLSSVQLVAVFVLTRIAFTRFFPAALLAFMVAVAQQFIDWGMVPSARMDLFAQVLLFLIGAGGSLLAERHHRRDWLQMKLLDRMSRTDPLTGLMNRRAFGDEFDRVFRHARRDRAPLAVMMLDVDSFKPLNDEYGHDYGDACLSRIGAKLMRLTQRPLDLCARYGGEEFALVFYGCGGPAAHQLAEEALCVIRALRTENRASRVAPILTASIGAVWGVPDHATLPSDWLRQADVLLYEAKRGGRNRVRMGRLQTGAEAGATEDIAALQPASG